MEKVVVGMSGGVDSFVAALLLQRQGYEVTGVMLDLWGEARTENVEMLCRKLGIGFHLWEGHGVFRSKVVEPFVEGYMKGQTPSPCCICNCHVKWALLAQAADSLGIWRIATGHYVRIERQEDAWFVRKGGDEAKDQSYFLWGVPQTILERTLTPLGGWTKAEVKAYAETNGYPEMAQKPESMGICFLQGQDYRNFILQEHAGGSEAIKAGNVVDVRGQLLGRHSGILNYTIGQKRGLPAREDGTALYVSSIDAETNTIVADVKGALETMVLEVEGVKAVRGEELFAGDVEVKVRGLGLNPLGYVRVEGDPQIGWKVHLASPAWAVAPGQAVAFYRGELLIGGGIVKK